MPKSSKWPEARAHLEQHPNVSAHELAEVVGVTRRTASDYLRRWREERGIPAPPPRRKPQRARAPVAKLTPDDRERALRTVRDAYALLDDMMGRMRRTVEGTREDLVPALDPKTAQALLNLQRMATGLIDAHPGLLELAQAGNAGEASEEDLEAILRAMEG